MELEFFTRAAGLAALAVVAVQQILKLKFIPAAFANRYPVPTNIALSILVSVLIVWQDKQVEPDAWTDWALLVTTVSVVAAIVYNNTLRNWTGLRAMEGDGKRA